MMYILGALGLGIIALAWKLRRSNALPNRDELSAKHYTEEAHLYLSNHSNWHGGGDGGGM
jgi:hypothetical protein